MNTAVLIISILLIIGSIVMIIVSAIKGDKNQENLHGGNVYSFNMPYWLPDNTTSTTQAIYGTGNSKQGSAILTCPAGKTIKTIGAYFSIYDPYGQCILPSPVINKTCSSANSEGLAMCENTCSSDPSSCTDTTGTNYQYANIACSSFGIPSPPSSTTFYSGQGTAYCIPNRDISAFVADIADGKQSITLNASDASIGIYGPVPCALADVLLSSNSSSSEITLLQNNYNSLPNVPLITQDSKGNLLSGLPKQGYTIHGVYACI